MNTHSQQGSGLIEVMVALLVLTVGLLGYAALEGNAIKVTREARQYSEASMLAYDFFDRVRSNRELATKKTATYETSYDADTQTNNDCFTNSCTAEEFAEWDLALWKSEVQRMLPAGDAKVAITGNNLSGYTVLKVVVTLRYALSDEETDEWEFEAVL